MVTNNITGNLNGRLCALKFSKGDIYTYKTVIPGLAVGEIVVVSRGNEMTVAAVVAVGNEDVPVRDMSKAITMREFDISRGMVTPKMRDEYRSLRKAMGTPTFFSIGIPFSISPSDNLAVSVRFIGNSDEYTYLTDRKDFKPGSMVIVPAGVFNLPKRAIISGYVDYPADDRVYKRVFGTLSEYNAMEHKISA